MSDKTREKLQMERYEGKKQVLACRMTRFDYNKYRGWELPKDENGADSGMLVEYIDGGKANHPAHTGYISWSPIDVFFNAYGKNGTYVERLTLEINEVEERMSKLLVALVEKKVPAEEVPILSIQYQTMKNYYAILIKRLGGTTEFLFDFGAAINALKLGMLISRKGWNGKDMFVYKQVPSEIGRVTVPKMQSVPQSAKDKIMDGTTGLTFVNQAVIVDAKGNTDNWVPSISDIFAEDWVIEDYKSSH